MWWIVALIITLILFPYVFYPIVLMLLPKREKNETIEKKIYSVTLYIAAYNEEGVIGEKLKNSMELDTSLCSLEIVVGSDGSTDKTNDIVQEYMKQYDNIRLLNFTDRAGKVNVLNRGIPLCKGEIILLSDANAMYNKDCLKSILPHFLNNVVGCVAGEKRVADNRGVISENEGFYWKLESKIKKLESEVATVIGADGACYAIRKSLFDVLPKDTSVDDFLLSMKIVEKGYVIEYEPNAYSYEETGSDIHQELKRKIRIAAGNFYNMQFLKNFIACDLLSFMYIGHKFLRWISPFLYFVLTLLLGYLALEDIRGIFLFILLLITYVIPVLKYKNICNWITDNKIGNICSYFYLTVWAQFIGYLKYKSGSQKAIWETIRGK